MGLAGRGGTFAANSNPPGSEASDGASTAAGRLSAAYLVAGGATMASWAACAVASLATYKPHRVLHNSIGVAQALTVLPLVWACFSVLADGARPGRRGLGASPSHRRLNLALAAASLWCAAAVVAAPRLTAANVRTVDPVTYAPVLAAAATAVHVGVAALCAGVWRRTVPGASPRRALRGVLSTRAWRLGPRRDNSPAVEYAFLSVAFAAFAGGAIFAPFPLATVPSLLGKRLARAYGAWALLAASACFVIKEEEDNRQTLHNETLALPPAASAAAPTAVAAAPSTATAPALKRGLAQTAGLHLAVAAARPLLESAMLYPAAMNCLPAVAASLLVFVLALLAPLGSTLPPRIWRSIKGGRY